MWGACATLPLLREGPALSAHFLEQKEGSVSEKCSSRLTQGSGLPMWFPLPEVTKERIHATKHDINCATCASPVGLQEQVDAGD
jgi:hypothetical protein